MLKKDFKKLMQDAIPRYYDEIADVQAYLDGQAQMQADIYAATQDVLRQFFVETATWGLARWEEICGIPTDLKKPIEERRSAVLAKLRGIGTVTVELIKNVTESWYGGEVEIIERSAEYIIEIVFVSSYGVPSNMADVERALREIIPAHLELLFTFKFLKYGDIDALPYYRLTSRTYAELMVVPIEADSGTHEVLEGYTHDQLSQVTHANMTTEGGE